MSEEEKTKPTNAELDAWMATDVMGWKQQPRYYYSIGAHVETWVDKDSKIIMEVKDYRPTEILEQAMEGAFKLGWIVTFSIGSTHWIYDLSKSMILGSEKGYPDCARKIVKTLYEERKEK